MAGPMNDFDIEKWREDNRKYDRDTWVLLMLGYVTVLALIAVTIIEHI